MAVSGLGQGSLRQVAVCALAVVETVSVRATAAAQSNGVVLRGNQQTEVQQVEESIGVQQWIEGRWLTDAVRSASFKPGE